MTSQSAQSRILLQTDFPELTLHARGKVRDLYSLNGQLLFVATDRISAFDYVLATGIPLAFLVRFFERRGQEPSGHRQR
jgi:phosphoribosylaminoimidazole-succinocarboxamide synthase